MSRIFIPMIFLTYHLIILIIIDRSVGQYQPLIFDPFTLVIYDLEDTLESPKRAFKFPYAVACPNSKHGFRGAFHKRYSLGNKSIMIERFYNIGQSIGGYTCEEDFKIAIVYHLENRVQFIEFGYEVYYVGIDYFENFNSTSYNDFKKIRDSGLNLKQALESLTWPATPTIQRVGYQQPDKEEGSYGTIYRPVNFIWISQVKLNYEHSSWAVKTVSYKVNAKAHKHTVQCKDYSLDEHLYQKGIDLDSYYDEANQQYAFGAWKIPESSGDDCREHQICVKKYSMAPPYNFQPSAPSSPLVCSNLTTIPIWYDRTELLLNYLDKFLTVIALLTNNNLEVTAGVHDILTLPTEGGAKSETLPVFLFASQKKIPIPKIIYKIVSYKTYDCAHPEGTLCRFGVVIVIHNTPEFDETDRVCPDDECERLGWESIQFAGEDRFGKRRLRHIYCCTFHGPARQKLDYEEDKTVKGELNLKRFPYYDGKLPRNEVENRQAESEDKMRELFEIFEDR